jgi:hypothetical protein
MKRTCSIVTFIGLLAMGSCFNPPEFSDIPEIDVEGVRTVEVPGTSIDSLIVSVHFKDGDGDIGYGPNENAPPYNERWFPLRNPSNNCDPGVTLPCKKVSFVDLKRLGDYVSYGLRRTTPGYDTLPEFVQPYVCTRYYVVSEVVNQVPTTRDTLYSELNSRYSNFLVDLYVKNGVNFSRFEFPDLVGCEIHGLDGRLPILAKDGDLSVRLPLEGTITYKVTSSSFYGVLRNKTVKLKVQLIDRAGNVSNEDFSNDFTFK